MTAQLLIDQCRAAGVRIWLKPDGATLGDAAPAGMPPALKDELIARKAELIAYVARPAVTKAIVPLDRHYSSDRMAMIVNDGVREFRQVSAGSPLPPNTVLWTNGGGHGYWTPGPAHTLYRG